MCNDNDKNGLGQPAIRNFFHGFYLDMTSFKLRQYSQPKWSWKKSFIFTENTVFFLLTSTSYANISVLFLYGSVFELLYVGTTHVEYYYIRVYVIGIK